MLKYKRGACVKKELIIITGTYLIKHQKSVYFTRLIGILYKNIQYFLGGIFAVRLYSDSSFTEYVFVR